MAVPAILTSAGTLGVISSEATTTVTNNSTTSVIVGAAVAVLVALIGGGVQIWLSRRRRNDPDHEPTLTVPARVAVLEATVADIKADLNEVLTHIRPWGDEKRHR